MLIHLATPVKDTPVAKLSPQAPREGEKLSVVAINGPRGAGHLASVGRAEATVEGQWSLDQLVLRAPGNGVAEVRRRCPAHAW